ncbi:hypothetical protein Ami103574_06940 [Aminipila butyrica]|uniref:Uncharacterized protein n=1 Tax=Aminipila butyrica TaxID=433296 RepID=A0A858BUM9_9FIRM|nr:hypothetical protein [Aminipila butyrica]QIB69072.1 hypothetical protein Ami103574_06940 [Aminipila butyrica]
MIHYDQQLQLLQQQSAQKQRTESKLKELYAQREELSTRVQEFRKNKLDEQADVDQLEGRSLTAFFYAVVGKKDEKLDKEREEAYAARVKYDVALRELSAVEQDIQQSEAELNKLSGCEQQYEKLLKDKAESIKALGHQAGIEIFQSEERMAYLTSQVKEIQEALQAGETALNITNSILSSLDGAEGWGTWDLFGGGLISDLAKHGHLDEAQKQVEYLQVQLRRFKTELTDVTVNADIQISIDGFLSFADYFFDGLFADWAVLDKINQSQTQVQNTKYQIERVVNRLNIMLHSTDKELENERIRLNDLIVETTI